MNNRYISKTVGNVIQIIDRHNFNRVIKSFDARSEKDEAAEKLDSLNAECEAFSLKFQSRDF